MCTTNECRWSTDANLSINIWFKQLNTVVGKKCRKARFTVWTETKPRWNILFYYSVHTHRYHAPLQLIVFADYEAGATNYSDKNPGPPPPSPAVWLPPWQFNASIRHASSVSSFKSFLKTFLFSKTFFLQSPVLRCPCMSRCVFVCVCVCACARMHALSVCVQELLVVIIKIIIIIIMDIWRT